jgi:hypothetical protein
MPQKQMFPRLQAGVNGVARIGASMGRLDGLEAAMAAIQHTLDVQFTRMAAMQTEFDLLKAKQWSA